MTALFGALLGCIVLRNVITPAFYSILFGVVGGMMIHISIKEMIPTAHLYGPNDLFTSIGIVSGMVVLPIFLVLIQF